MNVGSHRDHLIINAAGFLRSLGVGLMGVVLGIYLSRIGYSAFKIGAVVAIGLAGSAAATASVGLAADRVGRKRFLIVLSMLSAFGGLALYALPGLLLLLAMAFVGMLNGTGTERSATFALEQAVIPGLAPDTRRTWNLALYNVLIDGGSSLGALGAALPMFLQNQFSFTLLDGYRVLFLSYSGLYLITTVLYSMLSPAVEVNNSAILENIAKVAPETRKVMGKLTALFSLDSFGGGFLTDALVSYWFFRRFGLSEHDLGFVFFAVHVLNALSHLGAVWLARRIGLVNTMVFTHLVQFISSGSTTCAHGEMGHRAFLYARGSGRNGRSDPAVLRRIDGCTKRTELCERSNELGAQHVVGNWIGYCWGADASLRFLGATIRRRRNQDFLRFASLQIVSRAQAARRSALGAVKVMAS